MLLQCEYLQCAIMVDWMAWPPYAHGPGGHVTVQTSCATQRWPARGWRSSPD